MILRPVLLNVFIKNLVVKVSALGKLTKSTRSERGDVDQVVGSFTEKKNAMCVMHQ